LRAKGRDSNPKLGGGGRLRSSPECTEKRQKKGTFPHSLRGGSKPPFVVCEGERLEKAFLHVKRGGLDKEGGRENAQEFTGKGAV